MKARIFAFAAALVLSVSAFGADSLGAKATADSGGVYMAASLAPLGSFEWVAAPRYTELATVRHNAAVKLRKGQISVEQAEAVQARADGVRKLLDAAVAACAQDDRTGQCQGSTQKASRLLVRASTQLAALK
jgi:hypothetical protein